METATLVKRLCELAKEIKYAKGNRMEDYFLTMHKDLRELKTIIDDYSNAENKEGEEFSKLAMVATIEYLILDCILFAGTYLSWNTILNDLIPFLAERIEEFEDIARSNE